MAKGRGECFDLMPVNSLLKDESCRSLAKSESEALQGDLRALLPIAALYPSQQTDHVLMMFTLFFTMWVFILYNC